MAKPTAPKGLSASTRRYWRAVVDRYTLDEHEVVILKQICHEMDTIDKMQAEADAGPMFMRGSQNQDVANPMFGELRQHRNTLKGLMGALKLPDVDGRQAADVSAKARDAANARWQRRAG